MIAKRTVAARCRFQQLAERSPLGGERVECLAKEIGMPAHEVQQIAQVLLRKAATMTSIEFRGFSKTELVQNVPSPHVEGRLLKVLDPQVWLR